MCLISMKYRIIIFNYHHYQPGSNIIIVYCKHITHARTRANACTHTVTTPIGLCQPNVTARFAGDNSWLLATDTPKIIAQILQRLLHGDSKDYCVDIPKIIARIVAAVHSAEVALGSRFRFRHSRQLLPLCIQPKSLLLLGFRFRHSRHSF